jgi:hypothetical protein
VLESAIYARKIGGRRAAAQPLAVDREMEVSFIVFICHDPNPEDDTFRIQDSVSFQFK